MTTFTDDFNRANGAPGANWVDATGLWTIVSNQLSSGSAGGTIVIRAATAMATNDNSAQITIAATGAVSHGVFCRANTGFTSGYLWRNDGTSWALFSNVGGSFTSIGSFAGAAVAGDVAKIQAVGSTIKGLVNGIERVSVVNTAVTTGTSVGIRAESTNLLRFDDFTGADVTSGVSGDAALAATATLTTTGVRSTSSNAGLTATATLTATGSRSTTGDTALNATAALTATGVRTTASDAALATTATLTAAGQRTAVSDAALAATATLAASGIRSTTADTGLTATADLTAQGQVTHTAAAALAATATFTADGSIGAAPVLGDAALNTAATLTADGVRATFAAAGLTATATLSAAGTTTLAGSAGLAATATLTASGTVQSARGDVTITVGTPYSPWTAGPAPRRWIAVETPGPWTAEEAP